MKVYEIIILIILWMVAVTAAIWTGWFASFATIGIGGVIFMMTGWIIPTIIYWGARLVLD